MNATDIHEQLLVTLNTFPVALLLQVLMGKRRATIYMIRMQLYTAVLHDKFELVPRRFNKRDVPDFVQKYDYKHCNAFINSQPLS
jgi:hypothetical protein